MNEDDRGKLYGTLLHGMASDAQDRLCRDDLQHDWGRWTNQILRHDMPVQIVDEGSRPVDPALKIRSERRCQNCGKSEVR